MSYLNLPEEDPSFTAADRAAAGYLPNYTAIFGHRPEVYVAWRQLNGAIKASMDPRRYELATLAAAQQMGCSYCSLAHGKVLLDRFVGAEQLVAITEDPATAGLDEVEVAVMALAARVAEDANSVTQEDIDRLRKLGLTDGDVMDVVLAAAARCFFSKTLDALGMEPDAAYRDLEPAARDALTVGRPIAAG